MRTVYSGNVIFVLMFDEWQQRERYTMVSSSKSLLLAAGRN